MVLQGNTGDISRRQEIIRGDYRELSANLLPKRGIMKILQSLMGNQVKLIVTQLKSSSPLSRDE